MNERHGESLSDEEVRTLVGLVPPHATVKGLYVEAVFAQLKSAGHERLTPKKYFAFKDYSMVEWLGYILAAAPLVFPHRSLRESIRLFGQDAYPSLAATTAGKVIFSVAGSSFESALKLSSKAYEISIRPGHATPRFHGPGRATLELRDIWSFPDCYQVGVMEGAMKVYGVRGTVRFVRRERPCDGDLVLEWQDG